jgi:hypothetical protein
VFQKNISDGVGSHNGSNGTPLDPPLFWLDNTFKVWNKNRKEDHVILLSLEFSLSPPLPPANTEIMATSLPCFLIYLLYM